MRNAGWKAILVAAVVWVGGTRAADVPGGFVKNVEQMPMESYELVITPAYLLSPAGAYLSSEVRHQYNEHFAGGFGFGAGELGFNLGVSGLVHVMPKAIQPSFGVVGGLYFNRVSIENYLVFRIVPTLSHEFSTEMGKITPYAALQLTPAIGLGSASKFGVRASGGAKFALQSTEGLALWTELGIGLVNSVSEVAIGISHPFLAL